MRHTVFLTIALGYLAATGSALGRQAPIATQLSQGSGGLEALLSRDAFDPANSVTLDFEILPGGTDSGVALVNLSDEQATVFVFLDTRPQLTPGIFIDLPPQGQTARFLTELFGETVDAEYSGSLLIFSRHRISAAVLRTVFGRVLSSQPVAHTER